MEPAGCVFSFAGWSGGFLLDRRAADILIGAGGKATLLRAQTCCSD